MKSAQPENLRELVIETPLGLMRARAGENGLCSLGFLAAGDVAGDRDFTGDAANAAGGADSVERDLSREASIESDRAAALLARLETELGEYFAGARTGFDIPLSPEGTEFQRLVWAQLATIPYGVTVSYLEQATALGNPKAVRASASANGANPIAILVPCHRVIGSDGSLTGYAGGISRKRALLRLEGALEAEAPDLFFNA